MQLSITFPTGTVQYLIPDSFTSVSALINRDNCFVITDNNVANLNKNHFDGYKTIIIPPGETSKTWKVIEHVIEQLITQGAHRKSFLLGVGGGVVTDITGFIASVYMRGVPFGFVPTTLLGMADAAIGGKNGINSSLHKNLIGTIRQPEFILFDPEFLDTLPDIEWSNGFAEIIKYACLFDKQLFNQLEATDIKYYQQNKEALITIVAKCVQLKNSIVLADENESGNRKLLNFGHTAGHALETLYQLPHGKAVAIGMCIALTLSASVNNLDPTIITRLTNVLNRYNLPATTNYDVDTVMNILRGDKKRNGTNIDFITINDIGHPAITTIPFSAIKSALEKFLNDNNR